MLRAPMDDVRELGERVTMQLLDENWTGYSEFGYSHDTWLTEVWTQYSPFEFHL